jgi:hypothetical protein
MQQLLLELPQPELSSESAPTALDYVEVTREVLGVEPPEHFGPKFFEETTITAVLTLNEAERKLWATHKDSPILETLVHAQDWLCRDLPEWMHWVLRDL